MSSFGQFGRCIFPGSVCVYVFENIRYVRGEGGSRNVFGWSTKITVLLLLHASNEYYNIKIRINQQQRYLQISAKIN